MQNFIYAKNYTYMQVYMYFIYAKIYISSQEEGRKEEEEKLIYEKYMYVYMTNVCMYRCMYVDT